MDGKQQGETIKGEVPTQLAIQNSLEPWLDDIIQKGKLIIRELARETFIRYRQLGKLILNSGYRKGQWHNAERDAVLEAWEISQPTFSRLIQLGEMSEEEFIHAVNNFKSFREWANPALPEKPDIPLPEGIFNVIYADPPWQYDNTGLNGSAENHYRTLSLEELMALNLPVGDDAVLFLWVTNPMIEDALQLIYAWGFEYKTSMVWVKRNLEKPGVGFYVRGRHELLFICVRGSFLPDQMGKQPVGSVIEADVQEHSRKPDVVYGIIEGLYPRGKYLELFARRARANWTSWGEELVVAQ